ncbi:D-alanyl-D-alanine carboxypeptidase-like protein [Rarobacter incanus]|uniref:D-alanyl-D-alanine carboxypeptidase-like protein n=1 Tax=Rarobacter incanus TaxID=153494 RepID=A0A542SRC4_9MICO|nr:D-alanyl-D-alanine carboxypeptidase-like protein [Rarobacter incanus]
MLEVEAKSTAAAPTTRRHLREQRFAAADSASAIPTLGTRFRRRPTAGEIARGGAYRDGVAPRRAAAPKLVNETTAVGGPQAADRTGTPGLSDTRRQGARTGSIHAMPRARRSAGWLPKAAIVAGLAVATVALPGTHVLDSLQGAGIERIVSASSADATAVAAAAGSQSVGGATQALAPTTLSIIQKAVAQPSAPAAMAQSLTDDERSAAMATRSEVRSSLPGCDPSVIADGTNGELVASQLCELPQGGGYQLQPEAAVAFAEMSKAFEVRFGTPMLVTSAYRSYGRQAGLYASNPGMTAAAGKSNHGWGYAVDLDKSTYTSADRWAWLQANAGYFGFGNPDWAKGARYEPWHWEYMAGVVRVDNDGGTGYKERLADVASQD